MNDKNKDFLNWLDLWVKENFEDVPLPEYTNLSTYEKGVRKGMYEEKIFVGRTLRHRINNEMKRVEEEEKWKKEMEDGVD